MFAKGVLAVWDWKHLFVPPDDSVVCLDLGNVRQRN